MICVNCDASIRSSDTFCGRCGHRVDSTSPESSSQETATGSPQETSPESPSSVPPRTIHIQLPTHLVLTQSIPDYWRLGAVGALILSFFLPLVNGPGGFTLTAMRLGITAWIIVLAFVGILVLIAIPTWRPQWWVSFEQFISAALVGGYGMFSLIVIGVGTELHHVLTQFQSSPFGGLIGGLAGTSFSASITFGVGWILAMLAVIAWAVIVRRPES